MRGIRKYTESKLKTRKKMGLGFGHGADYKPAIRVQDFSSKGVQTRIPMEALTRTAHVHSGLERALFLIQEYLYDILEYKDQCPMDRGITQGCAAALGVKHPVDDKTGVPVVMTIDAVITTRTRDAQPVTVAYDVKPEEELLKLRVQEKLSITSAYCAHVGIPYVLFTERSATDDYIKNIDDVRAKREHHLEDLPVSDLFTRHPRVMASELRDGPNASTLLEFCQSYDARHSLPTGTGIRLLKHLVWNHSVRVDLTKRPWLSEPLPARDDISLVNRDGVYL